MSEILLAVTMFTGVILFLVVLILVARSKLVSTGKISINVNEEKDLSIAGGGKLLTALAAEKSSFHPLAEAGEPVVSVK